MIEFYIRVGKNMKKIAIVSTDPIKFFNNKNRGGGEVLFENLIHQIINREDCQLFIFYPADMDIDDIDDGIRSKITFIKISANRYSDKYLDEIDKIVEAEKFDVVINHNMSKLYKTTLLQCHSFLHRANNIIPILRPIKRKLSQKKIRWQKNTFKNAKNYKYIAVSNKVKQDYAENFNIDENNIIVSHPGCIAQNELSAIEKKDRIVFGIVANSSLNKGGHLFLFACGILKLLGYNFGIKIIAPKYNKDIFMKSIIYLFNMKKYTEVLPFQEEMESFYKGIDVLVLPSLNEAFGLVVLEAMSYSKPALVSSTAGASEIIDEENGIVFNRHSFIDFVNTLKYFIDIYHNDFDKYKQYADNAYKTSKVYSWENFANKII